MKVGLHYYPGGGWYEKSIGRWVACESEGLRWLPKRDCVVELRTKPFEGATKVVLFDWTDFGCGELFGGERVDEDCQPMLVGDIEIRERPIGIDYIADELCSDNFWFKVLND